MTDHGTVFPPRDEWDVAAYDLDEVVAGFRAYRVDDIDMPPGPNHSPAYRWGWASRRRDSTHEPDGFDGIRRQFIEMTRHPQ